MIANNINTISTVQTTLKYTEYTCQAALLATGVGGATVWLVKGGSFAIGAYGYIHAGKIIAVKSARVAVPIAAKTVVVGVGVSTVSAGVAAVSGAYAHVTVPIVEGAIDLLPSQRIRNLSKRLLYMGRTPGKKSKTGREVIERMTAEGRIVDSPEGKLFLDGNGDWRPLKDADMSHIESAVEYWNREGYLYGPKSENVREFILDSDNYYLEYYGINRSQGAQLNEVYRDPITE